MTIVSLTDCYHLLAIDPKTLRRWLGLSRMSAQPHPLDARVKGLTREQVQQLAAAHRRTLPDWEDLHLQPDATVLSPQLRMMSESALTSVIADFSVHTTDLTKQLGFPANPRRRAATPTPPPRHPQLQKEQEWRTTACSVSRETSFPQPGEVSALVRTPILSPLAPSVPLDLPQPVPEAPLAPEIAVDLPQLGSSAPARSKAMDRRKQPHVLPVVEYGVQGEYVVISPALGMLSFQPDSPEWFAWLSTLPSFRFVGKFGRLTAFRGYQCSPNTPWWAHRQIRNHSYKHRLGVTEGLTVAVLEQAAASLQSHMN